MTKVTVVRTVKVAIAITLSAASIAAAAPAVADDNDQQYLQVLAANGLACGQGAFQCSEGDDTYMIKIGRSICRQMHAGNSKLSIAQQIIRRMPNIPPVQAGTLVSASAAAYCP